jgi:DmsE family decaheme c-type cytochrome
MKKTLLQLLLLVLFFPGGPVCYSANAQEQGSAVANQQQPVGKSAEHASYTRKGADTCAMCHDEDSALPVFPITMTKHAQPADKRTPFAGLQCESCHGPGAAHAKWVQPGEKQAPIITFGADSQLTAGQQNDICLRCHRGGERIAWHSSLHDESNVSCTRCHRIHVARDPILETRTQPTVCYQCHKKERSDFLKPSKHPVRYGKMACSDCHQVHGGSSPAALMQPTLNQTCFTCHADKRGPLLWEHSPVTEDCGICHDAHGSVHPALLKKRAPLLCQQCHSQFGHPSVPRSAGGLPGATPSAFLLAESCMNCHSHIHGSNHPSGAMFMR